MPGAAGEQEATEDVVDDRASDLAVTEGADGSEDDESSPEKIAEAADDGGEAQPPEVTTGAKEAEEEEEEEGQSATVDVDAAVEGSEEDEEDRVSVTDPNSGKVCRRFTSRLIAEADDDDVPPFDKRWIEATKPRRESLLLRFGRGG